MRLINADALEKEITENMENGFPANENLSLFAISCIAHAPTVCDIEQIKNNHDTMMKYSYSYGKKDVLEQMRAEVRQLTEYGRMGDSKFILDTDVLRIIDSYTK